MISLPFILPLIVIIYILYYLFGPIHQKKSPLRSIEIGSSKSGEGPKHRNYLFRNALVTQPYETDIQTIPQQFNYAVEKYGSRPALGIRKTVKVEEKIIKQVVDGSSIEKKLRIPHQTKYNWRSYTDIGNEVNQLVKGLLQFQLKPQQDKIGLFAGTRPEWQLSAQACFSLGLPVVTVYPTLGVDAVTYSLDQTSVSVIITQASSMDIVSKCVPQLSSLKYIIYFDELKQQPNISNNIKLISYDELLNMGNNSRVNNNYVAKPNDLAVIMYTSGSTGNPKGVMMSHRNIIAACAGINACVLPKPLTPDDVFIAYLPLAHVLELLAENTLLLNGCSIGYSSPFTLRDDSVCDADSGKPAGDISTLRPTVMAAVPLILDRLRAGIQDQVNKSGFVKKTLFRICYYLKERNYLQGRSSPLLDRLIFNKIKAKFGGRLRYLLSGGAPLGADTQRFMNITICCPILQGYGLTETLGGGTVTHSEDVTTANVGGPIACTEVKLVDVPEMGYTSKDVDESGNPNPRGEVAIGGLSVAQGYYALDASKQGDFKDIDGVRWFYTGDIGQWNLDGTLSIIDRKKDLVKLAHGEYIALGNLESKYAHSELVENICIYGDSHHQRAIALIAPKINNIETLAKNLGISNSHDIKAVCNDEKVKSEVLKSLEVIGKKYGFSKFEIPAAVHLFAEPWTPESGLLTEALKLKRHEITKRFKPQIEQLYSKISE